MNKKKILEIFLRVYAAIIGALFGWAFAFLIITPLLQVIFASITGGRDTGPDWIVFLTKTLFIISMVASIIGGIYIGEKWCSSYLRRKMS